jgi:hypothetical protein
MALVVTQWIHHINLKQTTALHLDGSFLISKIIFKIANSKKRLCEEAMKSVFAKNPGNRTEIFGVNTLLRVVFSTLTKINLLESVALQMISCR